jgi:alkyl hydroperoxide reductase subunit AhpC
VGALDQADHRVVRAAEIHLELREQLVGDRQIGIELERFPERRLRAKMTEGRITFHQWLGDSWGMLFSHPKDFTPVCTTELGAMARMKPEFDKRNTKVSST